MPHSWGAGVPFAKTKTDPQIPEGHWEVGVFIAPQVIQLHLSSLATTKILSQVKSSF